MRPLRFAALCFLLASCSDDKPDDDDAAVDTMEDARVSMPQDASSPRDASTPFDARRPVVIPKQCEPGRYQGTFFCTIAGIAPWFGALDFSLVENTKPGGEVTILSVAAGSEISSEIDSMGGRFSGELQADFDCQTGQLKGELKNGVYLLLQLMPWLFGGPLEGSYELDDAGVPGFTGTLGTLTTPELFFYGPLQPTADCTWNATRVSDNPDGGT